MLIVLILQVIIFQEGLSCKKMWKFSPIFLNRNPNNPFANVQDAPIHGSNPALFENRGSTQFGPYYCPSVLHNQSHPSEGLAEDPLTQCIATFYWLGILVLVAYPVSLIALVIFILVSPLAAIFPKLIILNEFLLKVAHFPSLCAKNLIRAKSPGCFAC